MIKLNTTLMILPSSLVRWSTWAWHRVRVWETGKWNMISVLKEPMSLWRASTRLCTKWQRKAEVRCQLSGRTAPHQEASLGRGHWSWVLSETLWEKHSKQMHVQRALLPDPWESQGASFLFPTPGSPLLLSVVYTLVRISCSAFPGSRSS